MTQTVALQRGTTTLTPNNSNVVTLFTQSGGTATRVIVNQLGFYFASTPTASGTSFLVSLLSSGGQETLLGFINTQRLAKSYQLGYGNNPSTTLNGINISGNTSLFNPNPLISSDGSTGGVAATNANSPAIDYQGTSGTYQSFITPNFYMGPSDSVRLKAYARVASGKSITYPTCNISYSFTTITES